VHGNRFQHVSCVLYLQRSARPNGRTAKSMPFSGRPNVPINPQEDSSGLPNWAVAGLLALFVAAAAFASYMVYATVKEWAASRGNVDTRNLIVGRATALTPVIQDENTVDDGRSITSSESMEIVGKVVPMDSGLRITVLLMGIDQRAGVEDEHAFRTDTMMLVTVDPVSNTAGMLSIPRDLWVTIPGFENRDRINTANFKGDAFRLPGGGPALAMDTVTTNLGIKVDHYVRINFTVFEKLIDEIDGIVIDVPQIIDDPRYPDCCDGYDPLYISAGKQHMDGSTALKYARTRATFGADFDRAARQQQVLLAVREKVLSLEVLPTLIARAPKLYSALAGSYDTDLTLGEIVDLISLAKEIERKDIHSDVIDADYIMNEFTTSDGAQVVLLDKRAFRPLREQMFYNPAPQTQSAIDPAALAVDETATIGVQNGSARAGIAQATADYLGENGFNVINIGNADQFNYQATIIYDYAGRYYTTRWLAEHFDVQPSHIIDMIDPKSPVDVSIIIGQDFALP